MLAMTRDFVIRDGTRALVRKGEIARAGDRTSAIAQRARGCAATFENGAEAMFGGAPARMLMGRVLRA
jgi:hypothetical protein